MVNSMQANEAPQERMSAAWRLHKRGYEPRRGSVMVKTIDATTTDRLRRSPLYSDLSPSCARKRACMELTTICRFQRLLNPSFRLFQCSRLWHVSMQSATSCNMPKACPYAMALSFWEIWLYWLIDAPSSFSQNCVGGGKKSNGTCPIADGCHFGVTIYYFRLFLGRNYFIIFLTADWLPSV